MVGKSDLIDYDYTILHTQQKQQSLRIWYMNNMQEDLDSYDEGCSTEASRDRSWRGTSLPDLCRNCGPWKFNTSPIKPASYHQVLFELPLTPDTTPIPRYNSGSLAWDDDHVRMPFSPKNLFPVKENGIDILKSRWEIIKRALKEPITTSHDLERAIAQYSSHLPKLNALHHFFNEVLEEEESAQFFTCILPGIIDLALHLPEILPSNVPLLKQHHNRSLSLSQVQVASLLANAFLCTFPWRKDIALAYPGANFTRLFTAHSRPKRISCITEKLKCICHYFRRILSNHPQGVITFERKHVPKSSMPRWDTLDKNLGNTKVHIDSEGTIEGNGHGFLQIDFANKNIGGGVLGYGCVQEEIRFVICPELIISRLFVEQLGDNEAVVITGAERYSNYTGYGDEFEWVGAHLDETPFDEYGRRKTSIAVIDATLFHKSSHQFYPSAILREVNKAYVGFSTRETNNLAPVATGNWGCGAFKGSPHLKALIQLMACSATNRDLVYFSFGNTDLTNDFYNMHTFLGNNQITVSQLWKFLCNFVNSKLPEDKLYSYIQQSYFDSKKQRSLKDFFGSVSKEAISNIPSTSKEKDESPTEEYDDSESQDLSQVSTISEDIIPSSQASDDIPMKPTKPQNLKKKLPRNHDDILNIIDKMDGKTKKQNGMESTSLVSELVKAKRKAMFSDSGDVKIDIEDSSESPIDVDMTDLSNTRTPNPIQKKTPSKKISDYFLKVNKPS